MKLYVIRKPEKMDKEIIKLKKQMKKLVAELEFEEAAVVRDKIKKLEYLDLQLK